MSIYLEAVRNLEGETVTLASLHEQVALELIARSDHHIPNPPPMSVYFDDSFRLEALHDFLEWLLDALSSLPRSGADYIPR